MLTPQSGKTERRTLALLGSLCLFLSAIEYLIPKPLPFMRLGLANLPLLLALDILGPKNFFLLALLKVLGQGIIGGSLFSCVFLFSFAGTFSSAAVMYILRGLLGKRYLGFAGLGCAGAMTSNVSQLVLARYFIFGPALRYLVPPFLASGFITGIALGIICEYFCRHSRWYALHTRYAKHHTLNEGIEAVPAETVPQKIPSRTGRAEKYRLQRSLRWNYFNADALFIAGLLMVLIFILNRSIECRVLHFLFFCLLAWLSGKKNNVFITLSIMAGIVFFNLLTPYGKVLAVFGPLQITQGSLLTGLEKALILEGLVMLSRACIKSDLRLPWIGSLLGESLQILELMRERKGMIRRGHILSGIDTLMLEMEALHINEPNTPQGKSKPGGKEIVLLCGMVILTAAMGFGIMAYGQ
jgi:heptaprenyl diphosphate synthase